MQIDELINFSEIIAKRCTFYQHDTRYSVRFRFNDTDKIQIPAFDDKLSGSKNIERIARRGWIFSDLDFIELSVIDTELNDTTIHVFKDTSSPEWGKMPMPKVANKILYSNLSAILWDNYIKRKKK